MKIPIHRETFRILRCLLLGVVTTVAVAWGLAMVHQPLSRGDQAAYHQFSTPYPQRRGERPPLAAENPDIAAWLERNNRLVEHGDERTASDVTLNINEGIGVRRRGYQYVAFRPPRPPFSVGISVEAGWPAWALKGELLRSAKVADVIEFEYGMIQIREDGYMESYLPWSPIFPGFLINTLFHAVIWFGLFFGPGATRKAIRRKRGRCVKCGYDLRGHRDHRRDAHATGQDARATAGIGCPECGWNREDKTTNPDLSGSDE